MLYSAIIMGLTKLIGKVSETPPLKQHWIKGSIRTVGAILVCISLTACIRPYKIDIEQGNILTSEQVAQLEIGMTRQEVSYVMGTPLIADPFHVDRWDYVYTFKAGRSKTREQRRVTLIFANETLSEIRGELDGIDVPATKVDVEEMLEENQENEDPGFFERTWEKMTDLVE